MRRQSAYYRQAIIGLAATLILIFAIGARADEITLDAALDTPLLMSGSLGTAYLRVALKGFELDEARATPVNLAIVLDRSGSMQGTKLEEAKKAAVMAVQRLRDEDVVSVVTYDTTVHVLVPATKTEDRDRICAAIRSLEAGASTALFAGVSKGSAVFLIIVLAPLGLSGWLGWRLAREEDNRAEDRARELMRSTLRSLDDEIHALLAAYETELGAALDEAARGRAAVDREVLRRLSRSLPGVRQVFAVDPATGELLHPSLMDDLDAAEEDFLDRTRDLWTRGELRPDRGLGGALEEAGASIGPARGWFSWFWGDGLNLIFWRRGEGDLALGAELDRIRLLADVVALLPDTDPRTPALAGGRIRLLDTRGDALYEWGGHVPAADEEPAARQALAAPLSAWSLEYFAGGASTAGRTLARLLPVLVAGGASVLGLAFYFYRESSREMREAAQRVSFVNQVSHELKTPLTNIRMYAELLGEELDADDGPARAYVDVVISESQRLSRLILNILTPTAETSSSCLRIPERASD